LAELNIIQETKSTNHRGWVQSWQNI